MIMDKDWGTGHVQRHEPFTRRGESDMRTIVIGDIHGHVKSVEAALSMPCNVVFVGDYLDSFHQSVGSQIRCLTMVMDAVEAEPDRVVALLGNHEMSYIEDGMICSGWKQETALLVKHLEDRMRTTLKTWHWVGDYLITHAGIDQVLLDQLFQSPDEYLEAKAFNQIGRARGGRAISGGLYWNDFNLEMTPPNGLKQVVGHSYWKPRSGPFADVPGVRVKWSEDGTGAVWCVDNLGRELEGLMIDGDYAYPHPLGVDEGRALEDMMLDMVKDEGWLLEEREHDEAEEIYQKAMDKRKADDSI